MTLRLPGCKSAPVRFPAVSRRWFPLRGFCWMIQLIPRCLLSSLLSPGRNDFNAQNWYTLAWIRFYLLSAFFCCNWKCVSYKVLRKVNGQLKWFLSLRDTWMCHLFSMQRTTQNSVVETMTLLCCETQIVDRSWGCLPKGVRSMKYIGAQSFKIMDNLSRTQHKKHRGRAPEATERDCCLQASCFAAPVCSLFFCRVGKEARKSRSDNECCPYFQKGHLYLDELLRWWALL